MDLQKILKNLPNFTLFYNNKLISTPPKINVLNISHNSKNIKPNGLFIALNGSSLNGCDFVLEAIKKGAKVIVCEKNFSAKKNVCVVVVKNARIALSIIASNFFKSAHKKLKIIGITGTNGKSSCAYILHQCLTKISTKNPAFNCGLIGTNAVFIGNKKIPATLTTPDPITLNEIFYKMVQAKVKICVMEISAHAVYFNKIYGINFEVVALTNVKSDHLDFFKTKTNYKNQKIKLFTHFNSKHIVLNFSDKVGRFLFNKLNKRKNINLYFEQNKLKKQPKNCKNFCGFKLLKSTINKTNFVLNINHEKFCSFTNLIGKINLKNLSLCANVLMRLGIHPNDILFCYKNLFVEGRLNIFKYNSKINFVLDYAHTFSSTKEVLKLLKKASKVQNIIVLGSPGNRDEFKRKKTSALCKKFGKVILTADNPKFENPYKIMEEMKKNNKKAILIENREKAIKYALNLAINANKPTNIVVLGKGIEDYQDYNNKHIFYNDKVVIQNLINKKSGL